MFKIMREISPEISKIYLDVAKRIFKTSETRPFLELICKNSLPRERVHKISRRIDNTRYYR